jgi:hypothetical protein
MTTTWILTRERSSWRGASRVAIHGGSDINALRDLTVQPQFLAVKYLLIAISLLAVHSANVEPIRKTSRATQPCKPIRIGELGKFTMSIWNHYWPPNQILP